MALTELDKTASGFGVARAAERGRQQSNDFSLANRSLDRLELPLAADKLSRFVPIRERFCRCEQISRGTLPL